MRGALAAIAERYPALRIAARKSSALLYRTRFFLRTAAVRPEERTAVFAAYGGQSYACSPKAIYQYMCADPRFQDFTFVWLFKEPEQYRFLEKEPRTRVCRYGSKAGEAAVLKAKYWIFNFMVPEHWSPRRGQVYLQCWHGTPLKKLGLDLEYSQNAMNSIREIHDRYTANAKKLRYLLSPSPFASAAFTSAWGLRALGKERAVLETGYPRNDFLFTCTQADVEKIRKKLGLSACGKRVLLYAPTWRDDQYDPKKGYTYRCPVDFDFLREKLGEEYILLFRAHYLVADTFDFERYGGFVRDVSGVDDVNELYVVSDMLITDYSSVFFDYANLERPIVFYMYDMEDYRGRLHEFYCDPNELPGNIVRTVDELVREIRRCASNDGAAQHFEFNQKFNPYQDGLASKRTVEAIIE